MIASLGQAVPHVCTLGYSRPRTRKVNCRLAGESCPDDVCGHSAGAYHACMMVYCEPGRRGYASAPLARHDLAGSIVSKPLCFKPHGRSRSRAIDMRSPRRACRQAQVQVWPHHAPSYCAHDFLHPHPVRDSLHPPADNNGCFVVLALFLFNRGGSNLLQMSRFPPGMGCIPSI